jgi:hypothetical protein
MSGQNEKTHRKLSQNRKCPGWDPNPFIPDCTNMQGTTNLGYWHHTNWNFSKCSHLLLIKFINVLIFVHFFKVISTTKTQDR